LLEKISKRFDPILHLQQQQQQENKRAPRDMTVLPVDFCFAGKDTPLTSIAVRYQLLWMIENDQAFVLLDYRCVCMFA
jgi:hypothetical protein